MKSFVCPAFALALSLLAGCAASEGQLRSRVALDTGCDEAPQIETVDARTRTVTACGQRATYVQRCQGGADGAQSCAWLPDPAAPRTYSVRVDASALVAAAGGAAPDADTGPGDSGDDSDDDSE